jgi:hypothetical protein
MLVVFCACSLVLIYTIGGSLLCCFLLGLNSIVNYIYLVDQSILLEYDSVSSWTYLYLKVRALSCL